jgi:hypothetical protein
VNRAIFRYEVPVDDEWHGVDLSGEVLHVDSRHPQVVEFWALHSGGPTVRRWFRVFGTGHPLPEGRLHHRGTAVAPGGHLVWHLVEGPEASL